MEKQIATKKNHAIPIILVIIIVFLIIAVLFQNRHINRLDNESSTYTLAEKKKTELETEIIPSERNTDNISPEKNRSTETDNDGQARIKKLEAKIDDMQAWQDYLEETIKKEEGGEIAVNEKFRKERKQALSSIYDSFFEENNFSANKKAEFIDLIIEKGLEVKDAHSKIADQEEFQKEWGNIEADYDTLFSDLLSVKEYTAYQEYMETQPVRNFIRSFNNFALSGDNQLNKQQEKDLIAEFYRTRQTTEDSMGIKELKSKGNSRSEEDRIKIREADIKLFNEYSEAAEGIMTDIQMEKFNEYINIQISGMKMLENRLSQMPENTDSDTEESD